MTTEIHYIRPRDREIALRVRSALSSVGAHNLPLAHFSEGKGIDLLVALQTLGADCQGFEVMGDLGFDGRVQSVCGVLTRGISLGAKSQAIVPWDNRAEASHGFSGPIYAVKTLAEAVLVCSGKPPEGSRIASATAGGWKPEPIPMDPMAATLGSAVSEAAEGMRAGKVIHLVGALGGGKSLIARRLVWSMPGLTYREAVEISSEHSKLGLLDLRRGIVGCRPMRAPHHTCTERGLLQEADLAQGGVLYLEDFPDFYVQGVRALKVKLATLPTVRLVVSSNPCPCGRAVCGCSEAAKSRHVRRLVDMFAGMRVHTVQLDRITTRSRYGA